jgi:Flp pilus assembly protein TadG
MDVATAVAAPDHRPDEQGSALVEFVFLSIVLLIPLVYLVLSLGRLQAGAYAVSAAAREAGRAFVTSEQPDAAPARARAAAAIAFEDQGFATEGAIQISCSADPCLTPEARVSVRARVRVPLPLVPEFARSVVPLEIPVTSTVTVAVDRFRYAP